MRPNVSSYLSNNVFEGTRTLSPERVEKIKEKYKNSNLLKDIQTIHGKEEGLKHYNEIMEREGKKHD
jgi:hypothetical protein